MDEIWQFDLYDENGNYRCERFSIPAWESPEDYADDFRRQGYDVYRYFLW